MDFFKKVKSLFSGNSEEENEFDALVERTLKTHQRDDYIYFSDESRDRIFTEQVLSWPDDKKIRFLLDTIHTEQEFYDRNTEYNGHTEAYQKLYVRNSLAHGIFHLKLKYTEEQAVEMLNLLINHYQKKRYTNLPVAAFLQGLFNQYKEDPLPIAIKEGLQSLAKAIEGFINRYTEKELRKLIRKIEDFLFGKENGKEAIKPVVLQGDDALAHKVNPDILALPDEQKLLWYKWMSHMQSASGGKPSQRFLNTCQEIIREIGSDSYKARLWNWLEFLIELKEESREFTSQYGSQSYTYTDILYLTAVNAEAVKGWVWSFSLFHDEKSIRTMAALAERAFRKIPGKGPTCAIVGNACLFSLFKSKGMDGIGQLSRLKLRIKQSNTQKLIGKYLEEAAKEKGVTVAEIEAMAVDSHGLVDGVRRYEFDEFTATLSIAGIGKTTVQWYKTDGSLQKSVPAAVKENHASKLKKLKDTAKQIELSLTAQRDRMDRMLRSDATMTVEHFQQYYLSHGLMGWITRKLIWTFTIGKETISAFWWKDQWIDSKGAPVVVAEATAVQLWHPVKATIEEITSWRAFLIREEIQQPFKQAFREVYILTDAEINTDIYSNRMAAHILRQHQFNSLAKSRSWKNTLIGAFDHGMLHGDCSLDLPEYKLRAEFWIQEVAADTQISDSGMWNYVSTDQVRFIDTVTGQPKALIDVPALIFSEVMRDVDLFVGVASIGNDPNWQDSGALTGYNTYWQSFSFGELSEIAKSRKEILINLLPRLTIRNVAEVKDKFLWVKGKKRTYKIHLGSTNILMEPNDQYLCIVPDRGHKDPTEKVFLPFEGDNGFSIILSKAFLLAEDDKITDPTILSQLNHK